MKKTGFPNENTISDERKPLIRNQHIRFVPYSEFGPPSKQLVELVIYDTNRFLGTKNPFPEKINPIIVLRIVALYRMATFTEIGGKKFSSFPRGDPRKTQKLTPRYGALYWPPGWNDNMGAFWLRGESVLNISCKSIEPISSC
jgi:hypothetical protein